MKRVLVVFFILLMSAHCFGAEESGKSMKDQEKEAWAAIEKSYADKLISEDDYISQRHYHHVKYLGDKVKEIAKNDRDWALEKQQKQLDTIKQMLKENKYSVPTIESTEPLADEILARAHIYRQWPDIACISGNFDNCDVILHTIRLLSEAAADMKLTVGDYLVKAGAYSKAKRVYREVITTFTGDAYRSYTRKAEFALEDINGKEDEKPKGKHKRK